MRPNHNESLTPQLKEKLSKIKHVALDMDGTIYLGSTLFPFTKAFLAKMSDNGIGYSFLTNNPSKSVADYLKKLEGLGIEADEENMYTTSLAAIDYIKAHYPQARRLFLLGTPSMISQFEKAGFEVLDISLPEQELMSKLLRIQLISRYDVQQTASGKLRKGDMLSSREKEVLKLMIKGLTNKEIGEALGVSITTAIFHRNNICEKLQTRSIGKLTIFAVLSGIVDINEI